jgi:uncharacterized protein (DUF302 family)
LRKETPLKYTKVKQETMERSLLLFENSIKSKYSFNSYVDKLKRFMKFAGATTYDELTRKENLQELLEDKIAF